MSRIIKKKQKLKPPISMLEPLSSDELIENRVSQRQDIINELDLIKSRVDQVFIQYDMTAL